MSIGTYFNVFGFRTYISEFLLFLDILQRI